MCIVLDYIEKYPQRTKQILGISYEQLRPLTELSRTYATGTERSPITINSYFACLNYQ
ncbi:hypothetical protein H6G27_34390 [Nostoc linckia FACHB-104]|nr:hypothetical protein [Nostoc linckia FACHB-104]